MILREPSAIMERWGQYLQNLLINSDSLSTEISQELGEGSEKQREEIEEQRNGNEDPKTDELRKP
jgi:hypothetical protein